MKVIRNIIISNTAPVNTEVGWLKPLDDGTFKLMFCGSNGWTDAASGIQGPKGDTGEPGPVGVNGKSITAITLTTDDTGKVTGGTATLNDKSTIQITVTQS